MGQHRREETGDGQALQTKNVSALYPCHSWP
jgi:hypothetical protein